MINKPTNNENQKEIISPEQGESEISYKDFEIDGKIVKCRKITKPLLEEFREDFSKANLFRKKGIVNARQATEQELITTSQDGMKNYAEPGDWIIQNPGDNDPYVFGNKNDSIEKRQKEFEKRYEAIPDQPGKFRAKGIIKAFQITENLVFDTDRGETMGVKTGGWLADGGYAIAENSFDTTYEKLDISNENNKSINDLKKEL